MTKDELKAYNAAYHAKNRERRLAKMREWKAMNREKHRASSSDWQRNNPEASAALKKAYKLKNPEKVALSNVRQSPKSLASHAARQRVRNRSLAKPDEAVVAFYTESRSDAVLPCYWCGRDTNNSERHVDHLQPISNGGTHTVGNLVHACISCNLRKGSLSTEEFLLRRGEDHRR